MRRKLILIQFSRALVPVLVMLFHVSANMKGYWDYDLLKMSTLPVSGGVNYFFALSGFMLFYIYKEKFGQSGELKKYLLNRFIRIYPLYWVLTLIALPTLLLFPFLGLENKIDYDSVIHSLLLLPHPQGTEPILDIAWSLVYTVYFYLIFALFFLSKRIIPAVILSVWGLISIGFMTDLFWSAEKITYFFFYQYNLIFLAGILCAYLLTRIKLNQPLSILTASLGFITFPLLWWNEYQQAVNISFDIGTGLASALIIFGLASIDIQKEISLHKSLYYLGNASLSIYLAHNLPLNTFSHIFYKIGLFELIGGPAVSILLLAMITGVGCLVHSFIEKPIVAYSKKKIFKPVS
ncbi:acyltransferase family protein [Bacillus salacetis]|uniref:acyltransferase family protein n=1 Tax=Bacillus salacetis TaxID=2315464 RepID=UPI003B9F853D